MEALMGPKGKADGCLMPANNMTVKSLGRQLLLRVGCESVL